MKHYKPGQFYCLNDVLYPAKRRTDGCKGCALNDLSMCPNIVDSRFGTKPLGCSLDDIIFVRV